MGDENQNGRICPHDAVKRALDDLRARAEQTAKGRFAKRLPQPAQNVAGFGVTLEEMAAATATLTKKSKADAWDELANTGVRLGIRSSRWSEVRVKAEGGRVGRPIGGTHVGNIILDDPLAVGGQLVTEICAQIRRDALDGTVAEITPARRRWDNKIQYDYPIEFQRLIYARAEAGGFSVRGVPTVSKLLGKLQSGYTYGVEGITRYDDRELIRRWAEERRAEEKESFVEQLAEDGKRGWSRLQRGPRWAMSAAYFLGANPQFVLGDSPRHGSPGIGEALPYDIDYEEHGT